MKREHRTTGVAGLPEPGEDEWRDGFARPRVYLQPITAPSILGFFGLATATMLVGANLAGWYGTSTTPLYQFAFAGSFGGVTQLLACMWAFRARDGAHDDRSQRAYDPSAGQARARRKAARRPADAADRASVVGAGRPAGAMTAPDAPGLERASMQGVIHSCPETG